MKKVVVDTNVLVSGVFWTGAPHAIIQAWQKKAFRWLVSPEILQEYRRVMEDIALRHPGIRIGPIIELIGLNCEMVVAKPLHGICSDPDDDKFIAAALAGRADYIVSGDKALLEVEMFRNIHILKPADLLKVL